MNKLGVRVLIYIHKNLSYKLRNDLSVAKIRKFFEVVYMRGILDSNRFEISVRLNYFLVYITIYKSQYRWPEITLKLAAAKC